MPDDIRYDVLQGLIKLQKDKAYSNLVFAKIADYNLYDARDISFASKLFYGVCEKQITLEYIINQYSTTPINKINLKVKIILQMGLYQLLFMDKTPSHAVVNTCVNLTKQCKLKYLSGFVNAVLRNFIRNNCKYNLPKETNSLEYLMVRYSCPKEIIKVWIESYGKDIALKLLETNCEKTITIRVNTLKTNVDELLAQLKSCNFKAYKSNIINDALKLKNSVDIKNIKAFKEGLFHVQNESSQICCDILDPKPGEIIADVCCAPGGKSFTTAQIMQNTGKIDAFDIHEHKINLVKNTAKRLGINIISTSIKDASKSDKISKLYDKVLCDAPCSGLGIFNSKPDVKYNKTPTMLDNLANLQYIFLKNSSLMVKPGGVLVYSTCTLNFKENNLIANKFLKENKNFKPLEINKQKYKLKNYSFKEPNNQFTIFPQEGLDGFFIAAFKRYE